MSTAKRGGAAPSDHRSIARPIPNTVAPRGRAVRPLRLPYHLAYAASTASRRSPNRTFQLCSISFSKALDIATATCYAARYWGGGSELLSGAIEDAEVNDASRPSRAEPRLDSRPLNYAPVGS